MLTAVLSMLLGTLLMLLLTVFVYRKVRSNRIGRDDDAASAPVAQAGSAADFQPPAQPIEMHLSGEQIAGSLSWSIGFVALAFFLFSGNEGGGWRLLAWPVGLLALPLAVWSLWDAWNEQGTRVVADALGLQVLDRAGARSVAWSRVVQVRMLETWAGDNPNARGPKHVRTRDLVFIGAHGAELLKLRLPLRPAAASETFLASLPAWTGRIIEVERRGR